MHQAAWLSNANASGAVPETTLPGAVPDHCLTCQLRGYHRLVGADL